MLQSTYHLPRRNRDDMILAENIRSHCQSAKRCNPGLTFAEIAKQAGIHPTSFSRILAGNGASEDSLLGIAQAIGIAPGRFIARVIDVSKYPNIKPIRARTSQRRRYAQRSVRSIEDLINDPELASEFVGGAAEPLLPWLIESLNAIRQTCHNYRVMY